MNWVYIPHTNGTDMGLLYQYIRCSSLKQSDSGIGVTMQSYECTRKGDTLSAMTGDVWAESVSGKSRHKGQYVDSAISGYTMPFEKRPAGSALMAVLRKGDTLIVHRVCRLCRSSKDYFRIITVLAERGVRLIIISPKIDLGTAIGRLTISVCAAMAEFDSARKGERIRSALWAKKQSQLAILPHIQQKVKSLPSDYRPQVRAEIVTEVSTPGTVHVYVRVSHRSSVESGLGLMAQMSAGTSYTDELIRNCPSLSRGEAYCDAAVSAYDLPLMKRTDGKRLVDALLPGDHVVFYSMDRAFRNTREMLVTTDEWRQRGITAHFVSEGFDMSSPEGRLVATVAASLGEMEAALCSSRAKECRTVLAHSGKFAGGSNTPPFWRLHQVRGKRILVLDRYQIATFRCVKMLIEVFGFTKKAACTRVEAMLAKMENRVTVPILGVSRNAPRWRSLPSRFRPYRNGMVYPMWTIDRYDAAMRTWQATWDAWRDQQQKQRDALAAIAERLIPTRRAVHRRVKVRLGIHPSCNLPIRIRS